MNSALFVTLIQWKLTEMPTILLERIVFQEKKPGLIWPDTEEWGENLEEGKRVSNSVNETCTRLRLTPESCTLRMDSKEAAKA